MRWQPRAGRADALAARHRQRPDDLEARLQCQIAAWLSVSGLANVSLGLSHGLGHQLGGRCKVAHGHTSCVFLPQVLGFNAEVTAARRTDLCRRLEAALNQPLSPPVFQTDCAR